MELPLRHLILKPEEVKLLTPLGVFKVKTVGKNFIVVGHGTLYFQLRGHIPDLVRGDSLWVYKDLLVPKHQPMFG